MARTPGTFPVSFNLEPQIKGPLDARMIVDTYADLTGFTAGNYLKNGFIVSVYDPVPSKRGVYQLVDENNLGATASWVLIGANGPQGTQGYNGVDGIIGGQIYYFNQSVPGYTGSYRKLSNSPISSSEVEVTVSLGATESGKLVSEYMSDSLNITIVPAGIQRFYVHFKKDSAISNIEVYAVIFLADQAGNIYFPGAPTYSSLEYVGWDPLFPIEINMDIISETATILPTDRIVIKLYATNLDSVPRTVKFYTEGSQNYSYVRTSTSVAPGPTGPQGNQGFQGFQGVTGSTEAPLTELNITGDRNNINKVFTLSNPLTVGTSHMFFINGELQVYSVDYTISGTTLTLSAGNPAPTPTDSLRIFGTIGNIVVGIQGNQGYQGFQGFKGDDGNYGGDTLTWILTALNTAPALPPTGGMYLNGSTFATTTQISFSLTDNNTSDATTWLTALATSTNTVKGSIRLSRTFTGTAFGDYRITGVTIGTFATLNVTYVTHNGSASNFLTNKTLVSFARSGDSGFQGPQGFQGFRGFQGFQGPIGPQGSINKLFNPIGTSTYTLANTDTNLIMHFTATSNVTVTVPVGLSPYNRYEGKQLGLGQVGFTAGAPVGATSVSIITAASEYPKTAEQYSAFALDYIGLSGSIEQYMLYGKLAIV